MFLWNQPRCSFSHTLNHGSHLAGYSPLPCQQEAEVTHPCCGLSPLSPSPWGGQEERPKRRLCAGNTSSLRRTPARGAIPVPPWAGTGPSQLPRLQGHCSEVCSCIFTIIKCLIARLGLAAVFACGLNDDLSRSSLATPHSPACQRQPQGER